MSDKVIDGQKEATVSNGRRLRIRAVRPTDKQKLLHGFENLSSESRYLRFLVHKNGLTQEELRFFTEFDGINHYALAVLELDSQSQEGDCIGVARLIRVPDDANVGEVALVVTDTSQHKGIGRLLLQRLLIVAAVQGIRRVRFFCLPYNEPIRRLIKHVFEDATLLNEDGFSTGEFDIPAHVRLSVSSL